MEAAEETQKAEIIIVRRANNNGDDEHHGGVWKIAYADFMTAMMAFFLVMWLVNVASEDAKQSVANYFNPIKLVDPKPQQRGIEDDSQPVKEPEEQEIEAKKKPSENKALNFDDEAKMMDEPYGALETIAMLDRQDGYKQGEGGDQLDSRQPLTQTSGPRDPFSPQYWEGRAEIEDVPDIPERMPKEDSPPPSAAEQVEKQQEPLDQSQDTSTPSPKLMQTAEIVADDAQHLMKKVMQGFDEQEKPQMDVRAEEDGIVIELTDTKNYGMFAVGSAKPETHVVDLLEGLAKIIEKYPGDVVISGYTDARPYRNTAHYDNWQLSAARAQMAHYMLVRGGLDETRILKVEGYADRKLKNEQDSYAAENRRIAIFLKTAAEKLDAEEVKENDES